MISPQAPNNRGKSPKPSRRGTSKPGVIWTLAALLALRYAGPHHWEAWAEEGA